MTNPKDYLKELVYLPVSVEEKALLPENCQSEKDGICQLPHSSCKMCSQDLKERKHSYVLSPEELLEMKKQWAAEAFEAGKQYGFYDAHNANAGDIPDEESYINSLML
jgi:hypothetical protein